MEGLEKILDEIEKKIERVEQIIVDKPYDKLDEIANDTAEVFIEAYKECQEVIRKHMNGDWIPIDKEWPPFGQRLQATILHHEWVSDYDSEWVPEEEKIHHPAYTEVCEIYPMGALWAYACAEDDYHRDVAYIEPAKDLNRSVAEIIAWRPLPEPYRPERSKK